MVASQGRKVTGKKSGTGKAKRFEDLWIWQHARELVKEIYRDFHSGAGSKDFGFRDQIQRAGVSIMNIYRGGIRALHGCGIRPISRYG